MKVGFDCLSYRQIADRTLVPLSTIVGWLKTAGLKPVYVDKATESKYVEGRQWRENMNGTHYFDIHEVDEALRRHGHRVVNEDSPFIGKLQE